MEKTEEEQKLEALREAHQLRAAEIVANCAFTYMSLTDRAKEACKTIEMIFEEVTHELALLLPNDFRTALCLENLELACMWAKKGISVHDQYLAKIESKKNETSNKLDNPPFSA